MNSVECFWDSVGCFCDTVSLNKKCDVKTKRIVCEIQSYTMRTMTWRQHMVFVRFSRMFLGLSRVFPRHGFTE